MSAKHFMLMIRDGGAHCLWCDRPLRVVDDRDMGDERERATLEHVIPRSSGGTGAAQNLTLACFRCNSTRGDALFPPVNLIRSIPRGGHAAMFRRFLIAYRRAYSEHLRHPRNSRKLEAGWQLWIRAG